MNGSLTAKYYINIEKHNFKMLSSKSLREL